MLISSPDRILPFPFFCASVAQLKSKIPKNLMLTLFDAVILLFNEKINKKINKPKLGWVYSLKLGNLIMTLNQKKILLCLAESVHFYSIFFHDVNRVTRYKQKVPLKSIIYNYLVKIIQTNVLFTFN
jgi:hypothetical protein